MQPTAEHEEDEEMQGEPVETKETPGVSSSGRGEKRTETQENVSVKKRVMMMKSPKRRATPVSPPDLLHTVNTLLNAETGEEEKPWSEEAQETKILSVLDDHEEMMKGRQKEMGVMTTVKRSEAAGKRVIQTRWVDREEDG